MYARLPLLILTAAAGLTACREEKPPPPSPLVVRYETATRTNRYASAQSYIGLIKADTETDLSFKVPGIVEQIGPAADQDWKEGVKVVAATNLAWLKRADFSNNLSIASANADLDNKLFARSRQLLETGAVSQQEFDNINARKLASDAALANARQALADSVIFAPAEYDCTILNRHVNAGQTVAAGQAVLRIGDMRHMSVEIGIPDKLVAQFRPGKKVPVTISALEGHPPFEGTVSEVGAAAREGSRLFKIVIKVENQDGRIRSGMTASVPVDAAINQLPGSVVVPLSALVAASKPGPAKLAVFVVEGDRVREQEVITDDIVGSSITVTDGLKPDDKVVVVGAGTLYDGALVNARTNSPLK